MRCALQAGLDPGPDPRRGRRNLARVLAGEPPAELGPPPGVPRGPMDPLLERS